MNKSELGITCVLKDNNSINNYVNRSSLVNFSKEKHLHNGIGLKIVLSGKENYSINGKWQTVKAGNFLVINHHQTLEIDVKSGVPTKGICIYLSSGHFNNERTNGINELAEGVFHLGDNHWLYDIIRTVPLQTTYQESAFFETLFFRLVEENLRIKRRISPLKAKNKLTKIDALRKVETAKSLMTSTTNQKMSLQFLASEVGVSKFHFARIFKSLTGTTPAKFQQNYRLESAFADLKYSDTSISDLAIKYGFTDVHHFSKAFKQKYKISPSHIN
jgi:AraC-like DNA-binding protein